MPIVQAHFAQLFNIGDFALTVTVVHFGLGKHLIAVAPKKYILILKALFAFEIMYASTISIAKLSILLFYRRIFEIKHFRIMTYFVIALILGWWVAVVLVVIFSCHTITGNWDETIEATCIDSRAFYLGNSIVNILSDVIILVLPVQMVWRLQISRGEKVALTSIFGLGGLIVIISSVRIAFIIEVGPDFTWDYTNPIIWSDIETSVAVICACLPSLRPVAHYAFSGLSSIVSRRNKTSGGEGSEHTHQLNVMARDPSYVRGTKNKAGVGERRNFENLDEEWDGCHG